MRAIYDIYLVVDNYRKDFSYLESVLGKSSANFKIICSPDECADVFATNEIAIVLRIFSYFLSTIF